MNTQSTKNKKTGQKGCRLPQIKFAISMKLYNESNAFIRVQSAFDGKVREEGVTETLEVPIQRKMPFSREFSIRFVVGFDHTQMVHFTVFGGDDLKVANGFPLGYCDIPLINLGRPQNEIPILQHGRDVVGHLFLTSTVTEAFQSFNMLSLDPMASLGFSRSAPTYAKLMAKKPAFLQKYHAFTIELDCEKLFTVRRSDAQRLFSKLQYSLAIYRKYLVIDDDQKAMGKSMTVYQEKHAIHESPKRNYTDVSLRDKSAELSEEILLGMSAEEGNRTFDRDSLRLVFRLIFHATFKNAHSESYTVHEAEISIADVLALISGYRDDNGTAAAADSKDDHGTLEGSGTMQEDNEKNTEGPEDDDDDVEYQTLLLFSPQKRINSTLNSAASFFNGVNSSFFLGHDEELMGEADDGLGGRYHGRMGRLNRMGTKGSIFSSSSLYGANSPSNPFRRLQSSFSTASSPLKPKTTGVYQAEDDDDDDDDDDTEEGSVKGQVRRHADSNGTITTVDDLIRYVKRKLHDVHLSITVRSDVQSVVAGDKYHAGLQRLLTTCRQRWQQEAQTEFAATLQNYLVAVQDTHKLLLSLQSGRGLQPKLLVDMFHPCLLHQMQQHFVDSKHGSSSSSSQQSQQQKQQQRALFEITRRSCRVLDVLCTVREVVAPFCCSDSSNMFGTGTPVRSEAIQAIAGGNIIIPRLRVKPNEQTSFSPSTALFSRGVTDSADDDEEDDSAYLPCPYVRHRGFPYVQELLLPTEVASTTSLSSGKVLEWISFGLSKVAASSTACSAAGGKAASIRKLLEWQEAVHATPGHLYAHTQRYSGERALIQSFMEASEAYLPLTDALPVVPVDTPASTAAMEDKIGQNPQDMNDESAAAAMKSKAAVSTGTDNRVLACYTGTQYDGGLTALEVAALLPPPCKATGPLNKNLDFAALKHMLQRSPPASSFTAGNPTLNHRATSAFDLPPLAEELPSVIEPVFWILGRSPPTDLPFAPTNTVDAAGEVPPSTPKTLLQRLQEVSHRFHPTRRDKCLVIVLAAEHRYDFPNVIEAALRLAQSTAATVSSPTSRQNQLQQLYRQQRQSDLHRIAFPFEAFLHAFCHVLDDRDRLRQALRRQRQRLLRKLRQSVANSEEDEDYEEDEVSEVPENVFLVHQYAWSEVMARAYLLEAQLLQHQRQLQQQQRQQNRLSITPQVGNRASIFAFSPRFTADANNNNNNNSNNNLLSPEGSAPAENNNNNNGTTDRNSIASAAATGAGTATGRAARPVETSDGPARLPRLSSLQQILEVVFRGDVHVIRRVLGQEDLLMEAVVAEEDRREDTLKRRFGGDHKKKKKGKKRHNKGSNNQGGNSKRGTNVLLGAQLPLPLSSPVFNSESTKGALSAMNEARRRATLLMSGLLTTRNADRKARAVVVDDPADQIGDFQQLNEIKARFDEAMQLQVRTDLKHCLATVLSPVEEMKISNGQMHKKKRVTGPKKRTPHPMAPLQPQSQQLPEKNDVHNSSLHSILRTPSSLLGSGDEEEKDS